MTETPLPLCPISRAAIILGSRWSAEILRELLARGTCRFSDLEAALTGIAPTTLSNRLKVMQQSAIVERRFYQAHPPRAEYVLTEKGRKMQKILSAMQDWGEEFG